MGCPEQNILAFLGGWKYKLSKQRIKSNTHAEGIFCFIFQKEAIFAGVDTLRFVSKTGGQIQSKFGE